MQAQVPQPLHEQESHLELPTRLGMKTGGVVGAWGRRWGAGCATVTGLRLALSEAIPGAAAMGLAVISGSPSCIFPAEPAAVCGLAEASGEALRDDERRMAAGMGPSRLGGEALMGCLWLVACLLVPKDGGLVDCSRCMSRMSAK